jgi:hypothetical protein
MRMIDQPGKGICRRRRPEVFRETEGAPPDRTVMVHSHYPFVALADVGCDEYRPQLGRVGNALRAVWRFVVSL